MYFSSEEIVNTTVKKITDAINRKKQTGQPEDNELFGYLRGVTALYFALIREHSAEEKEEEDE